MRSSVLPELVFGVIHDDFAAFGRAEPIARHGLQYIFFVIIKGFRVIDLLVLGLAQKTSIRAERNEGDDKQHTCEDREKAVRTR